MREAAELDTERPSIKHWNDRIDEFDNTAVRLFYPVYRGDLRSRRSEYRLQSGSAVEPVALQPQSTARLKSVL
jgi:hypothetical protein